MREHGPGELAAVVRHRLPGPRDAGGDGRRARRARAAARAPRRSRRPRSRARSRRRRWRSGIADLLERRTDTLSGGELQRVALAAALVHRPALLVLDEPTSQLDPVAGDELVWLLRRLNEEWGTAVVDRRAPARSAACRRRRPRGRAGGRARSPATPPPREYLAWAADAMPALATPGARLFSLAGLPERPRRSRRRAPRCARRARAGARAGRAARARRSARCAACCGATAGPTPRSRLRGVWLELRGRPGASCAASTCARSPASASR